MDIGYIIKFGRIVPGREGKAVELFAEAVGFWQGHLASGRVMYFEPFLSGTGDFDADLGFFIIKGPEEELRAIVRSEEFRVLTTKASLVSDHFREEWLLVGEEVTQQLERFSKVLPEYAMA